MWADAQGDGLPAEYRWRPLQNFRNSIPCTTLQSLADADCLSAVQKRCQYRRTQVLDTKWSLHVAKLCYGARAPGKCLYSVPAQKTAKYCVKFGWPLLSVVSAATKPRCETRWNLLGCRNWYQLLVSRSSPYCADIWRSYCCLTIFFPIVDICLKCEDTAAQCCAMVRRWRVFVSCISARHVQHISDLYSKFTLRPHHVWKYDRHPISDR